MLSHLFTVCLALLTFTQGIQIHKRMTREEVRETFHTGHDNVPEYEVVRIYHTLHKRDVNSNSPPRVMVNALNYRLSLYLEPYQGLLAGESTPIYTVTEDLTQPEGLKYTLQPNALDTIGDVYQSITKRSAIIAYEGEDGETLIQGNLLEDLSVAPLPHRLQEVIKRETRELEDLPDGLDGETDFRRSHHHVVFKRGEANTTSLNDCIQTAKPMQSSGAIANDRPKRSIPVIVYPEILPIVDFSLYTALGSNVVSAARYVLAFWNGVDLRYRLLEKPLIRLSIGGVIISEHLRGTPYLESNGLSNTLDADRALTAMSQYFYKHDRLRFVTYDLAIAMTNLDMCVMKNGVCDPSTCGYAFIGTACNKIDAASIDQSVGIIEDNGGYSGINTATHELGHLLGARHDGLPATKDCPDDDGYIMAHEKTNSENSFRWSSCSLKQFYDFLSDDKSRCLRNMPTPDIPIHRLLPGQLMTPDEQCGKVLPGSKACNNGQRVCLSLICQMPGTPLCTRIQTAAAEGSSCGVDMYCINGFCVSKKSTIVPT